MPSVPSTIHTTQDTSRVGRVDQSPLSRQRRALGMPSEQQSLVLKTVGLARPLAKALRMHASKIQAAFVFGSVAKGADTATSDIDLMVIGDHLDYSDLYTALQDVEAKLHRKVNPLFLTPEDWRRKVSVKDSFAQRISTQPKIFVVGSESALSS